MHYQYVIFELEQQNYAILIDMVSEITEMKFITKMPKRDAFVEGILDLRGKIIPIINLKTILCLEDTRESKQILIVKLNEQMFGFIIDLAIDVKLYDESNIELVNHFGSKSDLIIQKVIVDEHGITSILDIVAMLESFQIEAISINDKLLVV